MLPGYDPRHVKDPDWAMAWWRQHALGGSNLGLLDMARIASPVPVAA
jgi:hypothetical protein